MLITCINDGISYSKTENLNAILLDMETKTPDIQKKSTSEYRMIHVNKFTT